MNLLNLLQRHFHAALSGLVPNPDAYTGMVRPAQDPRHGDYQANFAMSLAKVLSRKPREVAEEIVARLPPSDLFDTPEIAGPGFINVRLKPAGIATRLQAMAKGDRLGISAPTKPETLVIDYSSPNVAKPMHVGHLRSTIIGDALARLFRYLGHTVVSDNHLGDWGTQFGMLLYGYKNFLDKEALKADPVQEMARLYIKVRKLIKPAEPEEEEGAAKTEEKYTPEEIAKAREVQAAARQETAKLHAGDPENVRLWQSFMPWCREEIDRIYRRLDVHFDETLGESHYNPMLPAVVEALQKSGLAQVSDGALIVRRPEDQRRMKDEPPAIVRKSDGAFTYTTTDLATIRHRLDTWKPSRILYVVDSRQAFHFELLFWVAKRVGAEHVALDHISFGSVLDPVTKKPIKTREGSAVATLVGLLDEGVAEAARRYETTRAERIDRGEDVPELSEQEKRNIAEVVGLGAIKYADLSQNRTSDYVFSWDKMLAMDGNTATYMQYAYARIRSILRKGEVDVEQLRASNVVPILDQPEERALGLWLLRWPEALDAATAEYKPNMITAYLWDLAKAYSVFNTNCRVLKPEKPEYRPSRLMLCDLTARVIQKGLELLGIRTVERM